MSDGGASVPFVSSCSCGCVCVCVCACMYGEGYINHLVLNISIVSNTCVSWYSMVCIA